MNTRTSITLAAVVVAFSSTAMAETSQEQFRRFNNDIRQQQQQEQIWQLQRQHRDMEDQQRQRQMESYNRQRRQDPQRHLLHPMLREFLQ